MLKEAIKFLTKDTAIYGIAGAVTKFIAVFTVPIIARLLSKEEFGILNTITAVSPLFIGFITLGVDSSIARWFFEKDNDEDYKKEIVSTGFFIQLFSFIFFTVIFLSTFTHIGSLLFNNDDLVIDYWKVYVLSIPASAFLIFSNNLFKWNFDRNKYLLITIGNSLLTVGLTLFFLIYLKLGLLSALLGPVISFNIFSIVAIIMNRKYISVKYIGNKKLIFEMLKYGFPFAIMMIIASLVPSVDRLFLLRYVDMGVIGDYSLSLKIAGLLMLFISAFQISFGPYAFANWKKDNASEVFGKILIIYFGFIISVGSLLMLFGDIAITLFAGKKYLNSIVFLPFIIFAFSIKSLSEFTLLGIFWSKKTILNLFSSLFLLVVLFSCNYFLTGKFTVFGACISLLIANTSYVFLTYFLSKKYYPIPVDFYKLSLIIIVSVMIHLVCIYDFYAGEIGIWKYFISVPYLFSIYFIITNKSQRAYLYQELDKRFDWFKK